MPSNKTYWDRIHRIMQRDGVSAREAQRRINRYFKDAGPEATRTFRSRYHTEKHDGETLIFRDGERVSPRQAEKALDMTFYHSMVRRLSVWHGLEQSEVRAYLASFANWRDGISPLFRGEDLGENEESEE